jgi:hypothetical protein
MQRGILAIFNNIAPGRDADFDGWFEGEHLAERLAVPGFLYGQRHKAIAGAAGYFNFYVTESPATLTSASYLERLDNPTPRTRIVMSEIFRDMNRTACRREFRLRDSRSSMIVTARFATPQNAETLRALVHEFATDETVGGEIWSSAETSGRVMEEEKLRGGDRKIAACLLLDMPHQDQAGKVGERLQRLCPNAEIGIFRTLSHLGDSRA